MEQIVNIALDKIEPDPDQPRKYFDESKLQELAVTITEHGVRTPITVRPHPKKEGHHIINVGERRWRASQIAGKKTIPAIVDTSKHEPGLLLELQLIENSQRADIGPLEEGEAYLQLKKKYGHTVETLMARTGKSRSHVYARMRLPDLHPSAKKALVEGKLQPAIADLIASIADFVMQEQATKECLGLGSERDYQDGHVTPERADGSTPQPLSYRAAKTLIMTKYKLRLAMATFDIADASLTKEGACGPCPFRSGNQPPLPGLEASAAPSSKWDDLCTRPACFEEKTKAAWTKKSLEQRELGHDVLDFKKAEKAGVFNYDGVGIRKQSPWVDPKDALPDELARVPGSKATWKHLLGNKLQSLPHAYVQDITGAGRLLVARDSAVEVLRDSGKLAELKPTAKASPASTASKTPEPKKADDLDLRDQVLNEMMLDAVNAATDDLGKKDVAWLRWIAEWLVDISKHSVRHDSPIRNGLDPKKPWAEQILNRAQKATGLRQLITALVLEDVINNSTNEPDKDGTFAKAVKLFGTRDYKTVLARLKDDKFVAESIEESERAIAESKKKSAKKGGAK